MHAICTCVSKSLLEFGISLCSETVVGKIVMFSGLSSKQPSLIQNFFCLMALTIFKILYFIVYLNLPVD